MFRSFNFSIFFLKFFRFYTYLIISKKESSVKGKQKDFFGNLSFCQCCLFFSVVSVEREQKEREGGAFAEGTGVRVFSFLVVGEGLAPPVLIACNLLVFGSTKALPYRSTITPLRRTHTGADFHSPW